MSNNTSPDISPSWGNGWYIHFIIYAHARTHTHTHTTTSEVFKETKDSKRQLFRKKIVKIWRAPRDCREQLSNLPSNNYFSSHHTFPSWWPFCGNAHKHAFKISDAVINIQR